MSNYILKTCELHDDCIVTYTVPNCPVCALQNELIEVQALLDEKREKYYEEIVDTDE